MLVRGITPHGEEHLARARRLRRAAYILFFAFLLLALIAIPLFVSRFSQIIPPDDPAFIRQLAKPDAVWTFRPAPVAERLFGDAVVPLDLSTGLSTLHQHGQMFVYHPIQHGAPPEWVLVMSRRRPQWIYDGALRRLFPLESELDLALAYHIDRDRLVIASSNERMEDFRKALEIAGEVPKVDVAVVQEDPELKWSYIARFRGEWGLLPERLKDAITELTGIEVLPQTPITLTCDRTSDMIAVTFPLDEPDDEFSMRKAFTVREPSLWTHKDEKPWMILEGVRLTGEIEPGTVAPPRVQPLGRTY